MRPVNVEITMGHDLGISESYWRQTETEVLEDYLKAVPMPTINGENRVLQKQIKELTEKTNNNDYFLTAKLQEKEEQINLLIEKQEKFEGLIQSLIDSGQLKRTS
jgi:hypothetical protein